MKNTICTVLPQTEDHATIKILDSYSKVPNKYGVQFVTM